MISATSADESLESPHRGMLGVFLWLGLRASFFYCMIGVGNELLRARLPRSLTQFVADAVYGLPTNLLGRLGLAEPITMAALQGRIPPWIAAAAAPTLGVVLIFLTCLAAWGVWVLVGLIASLKQH